MGFDAQTGTDFDSADEEDWPQSRVGVIRPNVAPEPAKAVVCKNSRRVEVWRLMRGIIREAPDPQIMKLVRSCFIDPSFRDQSNVALAPMECDREHCPSGLGQRWPTHWLAQNLN